MANYGYVSDNLPEYKIYRYSIKGVTKKLGFKFGYKILYRILKELNILDIYNLPKEQYLNEGLFDEDDVLLPNGHYHPMTFVIGKRGLDFIKEVVEEYLKNNPLPKEKRRRKNNRQSYNDDFILVDDIDD